ncbi:hypothetical protein F4775DRAFT_602631 [Biscogniauxia sp. FL1348]|nr:hypothetical protein F4775DRAFT_602631 [Biscogniauxia sp. FL1348]
MSPQTPFHFDYNTAIKQQSSSLLFARLPLELRDIIYDIYNLAELRPTGVLNRSYVEFETDHPTPALLLTCRQAYIEGKDVLNRYLWFNAHTDMFSRTLEWHSLSMFQLEPHHAREVVVCYRVFDKIAPRTKKDMDFAATKRLQLDWKRPVESMGRLVRPDSLGDQGLDIMIAQSLYFIGKMPGLKEICLTGFYRDELPERLSVILREKGRGLRLVGLQDTNVRGGLNGLVQKWKEVLDALTADIQLAPDGTLSEHPALPPSSVPVLTGNEAIEHWAIWEPKPDWDEAASMEDQTRKENEKRRFGLPYEEIAILKRLAKGQQQDDIAMWG